MPTNILMPALSPTMEGQPRQMAQKEGDTVKSGDVIAEIETDKATMEVEAVDEGVLAKILVAERARPTFRSTSRSRSSPGDGEDASAAAALRRRRWRRGASTRRPPLPGSCRCRRRPNRARARVRRPRCLRGRRRQGRVFSSGWRVAWRDANIDLAGIGHGPARPRRRARRRRRRFPAGGEAPPPAATQSARLPPRLRCRTMSGGTGANCSSQDPKEIPHDNVTARPSPPVRREAKSTIPHFYLTIDCELGRVAEIVCRSTRPRRRTTALPPKVSGQRFRHQGAGAGFCATPDAQCERGPTRRW